MTRFGDVHDPNDYSRSQALNAMLRNDHSSNGILYNSVRCPEGEAVALFTPDPLFISVMSGRYRYYWDRGQVSHIMNMTNGEMFYTPESFE